MRLVLVLMASHSDLGRGNTTETLLEDNASGNSPYTRCPHFVQEMSGFGNKSIYIGE